MRGVGIDLVAIPRIERLLSRYGERFAARLFTPGERAFCEGRGRPARHYAARFAAKEAALKALQVPPGLRWHELEVRVDAGGAPRLALHGRAAGAARERGASALWLSLTHEGEMAAAVVVAEGR